MQYFKHLEVKMLIQFFTIYCQECIDKDLWLQMNQTIYRFIPQYIHKYILLYIYMCIKSLNRLSDNCFPRNLNLNWVKTALMEQYIRWADDKFTELLFFAQFIFFSLMHLQWINDFVFNYDLNYIFKAWIYVH
jgi:hypothetical protein